jgi:hypothetical protein
VALAALGQAIEIDQAEETAQPSTSASVSS